METGWMEARQTHLPYHVQLFVLHLETIYRQHQHMQPSVLDTNMLLRLERFGKDSSQTSTSDERFKEEFSFNCQQQRRSCTKEV